MNLSLYIIVAFPSKERVTTQQDTMIIPLGLFITFVVYFSGYLMFLWPLTRMIWRKCIGAEHPPESIHRKVLFVVAVVFWPCSLIVLLTFLIVSLVMYCYQQCCQQLPCCRPDDERIGNQVFKPKLAKRMYLKFWANTKSTECMCAICLDPFTHQDSSLVKKGAAVREEPAEPSTDATTMESAAHTHVTVVDIEQPMEYPDDASLNSLISEAATNLDNCPSTASLSGDDMSTNYEVISDCSDRELHLYNDDTCVTSCGHCFHYSCLAASLERRMECPECQQVIDLGNCRAVYRTETKNDTLAQPRLVYPSRGCEPTVPPETTVPPSL